MSKNFRASKTPNFDTLVTYKLLCKQVNQKNLVNHIEKALCKLTAKKS